MNGSTPARIFPGKGSAIHAHVLRNFRVDPLADLEPIIKNKFKTNHQKPEKIGGEICRRFGRKMGMKKLYRLARVIPKFCPQKNEQVGGSNTFIL